jgi:hypothetical protein
LRDALEEITRLGRLVVVGNGTPAHARALRTELAFGGDLWVDEEMRAYRAAGLHRSPVRALSWGSLRNAWRAWRGGFRQAGVQGDPWQLGGAFVVSPAGETLYAQVSREAGDHAPLPELLEALERGALGEA